MALPKPLDLQRKERGLEWTCWWYREQRCGFSNASVLGAARRHGHELWAQVPSSRLGLVPPVSHIRGQCEAQEIRVKPVIEKVGGGGDSKHRCRLGSGDAGVVLFSPWWGCTVLCSFQPHPLSDQRNPAVIPGTVSQLVHPLTKCLGLSAFRKKGLSHDFRDSRLYFFAPLLWV